jgi:integrase
MPTHACWCVLNAVTSERRFQKAGMKTKLTMARLKAAQEAVRQLGAKQTVLFDDGPVRGFGIRINRNSMLAFCDYSYAGRKSRMAIGRIGELSIEDARRRAAKIRVAVTAGEDPLSQKRAAEAEVRKARVGLTVAEAITDWIKEHSTEWSASTRRTYETAMARDVIPAIGKLPVKDLGRENLVAIVTRVKARSSSSASLLLRVIKSWITHLDARGLIQGVDLPKAQKIVKTPKPRDRVPSDSLLAALWRASEQLRPRSRAMLRLLILTGQRRHTVALMRWSDLDLASGTWTIPPGAMKAGKEHVMALGPLAVAELRSLPRSVMWCFAVGQKPPNRWNGILDALRSAAGDGWAPHDVRRAVMTWAVAKCYPRDHAKALLGHAIAVGIDKAYDKHPYRTEAARVARAWQSHIAEIIGEPETATVVQLRG